MINKYNDFLLEKEFNSILNDLDTLFEGKWVDKNKYEWNFDDKNDEDDNLITDILDIGKATSDKLVTFINKLSKDKVRNYYNKLINKINNLPKKLRLRYIKYITSIFLTVVSIGYLTNLNTGLTPEQINEIEEVIVIKKSSFIESQKIVKLKEGGYSYDKGDDGNWIKLNGKKIFIGTNHGISAPVLLDYYKRNNIKNIITQQDMIDLTYDTALDIFKQDYWDKNNLSEFENQSIANLIYDGCVNQGNRGMKNVIKHALDENNLNVEFENIFTKETIQKINQLDQEKLFDSIVKYREIRYKQARTFKTHGTGWLERLKSFEYEEL